MQNLSQIRYLIDSGAAYHRSGDLERAAAGYLRALALEPGHAEALARLGTLEIQRQQFPDAARLLRKALISSPRVPGIHYNLGLACQALGATEEAAGCFRQATRLRPDLADAWYSLGHLLFGDGDYERARDALTRAAALRPDHTDTSDLLGQCLFRLHSYAAAAQWLDRAVRQAPDRVGTRYLLGRAYARAGRQQDAVSACGKCLESHPHHAECHFEIGQIQLEQDQPRDALESFRRAVQLAPASTRLWRAMVHALQGVSPAPFDHELRQDLLACISRDDVDPGHVRHLVTGYLMAQPAWKQALAAA